MPRRDRARARARVRARDWVAGEYSVVGNSADFLTIANLGGVITDSHFSARDRMGRLLAFLARIVKDGWASSVRGIGVDEATAILVEPNGSATRRTPCVENSTQEQVCWQ